MIGDATMEEQATFGKGVDTLPKPAPVMAGDGLPPIEPVAPPVEQPEPQQAEGLPPIEQAEGLPPLEGVNPYSDGLMPFDMPEMPSLAEYEPPADTLLRELDSIDPDKLGDPSENPDTIVGRYKARQAGVTPFKNYTPEMVREKVVGYNPETDQIVTDPNWWTRAWTSFAEQAYPFGIGEKLTQRVVGERTASDTWPERIGEVVGGTVGLLAGFVLPTQILKVAKVPQLIEKGLRATRYGTGLVNLAAKARGAGVAAADMAKVVEAIPKSNNILRSEMALRSAILSKRAAQVMGELDKARVEAPLAYKFMQKGLNNAALFALHGQIQLPFFESTMEERAKTLTSSILTGGLFAGIGTGEAALLKGVGKGTAIIGSQMAMFGTGYGMAKKEGANNEDAVMNGLVLMFLHGLGQAKEYKQIAAYEREAKEIAKVDLNLPEDHINGVWKSIVQQPDFLSKMVREGRLKPSEALKLFQDASRSAAGRETMAERTQGEQYMGFVQRLERAPDIDSEARAIYEEIAGEKAPKDQAAFLKAFSLAEQVFFGGEAAREMPQMLDEVRFLTRLREQEATATGKKGEKAAPTPPPEEKPAGEPRIVDGEYFFDSPESAKEWADSVGWQNPRMVPTQNGVRVWNVDTQEVARPGTEKRPEPVPPPAEPVRVPPPEPPTPTAKTLIEEKTISPESVEPRLGEGPSPSGVGPNGEYVWGTLADANRWAKAKGKAWSWARIERTPSGFTVYNPATGERAGPDVIRGQPFSISRDRPIDREGVAAFGEEAARKTGGTWTRSQYGDREVGTLRLGKVSVRFVWGTPSREGMAGEVKGRGTGEYTITIDPKTGRITTPTHEVTHIAVDSIRDYERRAISRVLGYDIAEMGKDEAGRPKFIGEERFVTELETQEGRDAIADRLRAAPVAERSAFFRAVNRIIDFINTHLGTKIRRWGDARRLDTLAEQLRDLSILRDLVKGRRMGAEYATPTREASPARTGPVTPEQDAAYLAAVERGDTATAQKMVEEAAKKAGFNVGPVWHGTNREFNRFNPRAKSTTGSMGGQHRLGVFFSTDQQKASEFAGAWNRGQFDGAGARVVSAYLRLQNPKTMTYATATLAAHGRGAKSIQAEAIAQGHDGLRLTHERYDYDKSEFIKEKPDEIVVFDPSQIKSADTITRDDSGRVIPLSERFNPKSQDIRFQEAEPAADEQAGAAEQLLRDPARRKELLDAYRLENPNEKVTISKVLAWAKQPRGPEDDIVKETNRQMREGADTRKDAFLSPTLGKARHFVNTLKSYAMHKMTTLPTKLSVLSTAAGEHANKAIFEGQVRGAHVGNRVREMLWEDPQRLKAVNYYGKVNDPDVGNLERGEIHSLMRTIKYQVLDRKGQRIPDLSGLRNIAHSGAVQGWEDRKLLLKGVGPDASEAEVRAAMRAVEGLHERLSRRYPEIAQGSWFDNLHNRVYDFMRDQMMPEIRTWNLKHPEHAISERTVENYIRGEHLPVQGEQARWFSNLIAAAKIPRFTKEKTIGKTPFVIRNSMDMLFESMRGTSELPMMNVADDLDRMLQKFDEGAMTKLYGNNYKKVLTDEIAKLGGMDQRDTNRLIRWIASGQDLVRFSDWFVAPNQFASFWPNVQRFGFNNAFKGMKLVGAATRQGVRSISDPDARAVLEDPDGAYLKYRIFQAGGAQELHEARLAEESARGNKVLAWVRDKGTMMIRYADQRTVLATIGAALEKGKAEGLKGTALYKYAAREATMATNDLQPIGVNAFKTSLQNTTVGRYWLSRYMTVPNAVFNDLIRSVIKVRRGEASSREVAGKFFWNVVMPGITLAAMKSIKRQGREGFEYMTASKEFSQRREELRRKAEQRGEGGNFAADVAMSIASQIGAPIGNIFIEPFSASFETNKALRWAKENRVGQDPMFGSWHMKVVNINRKLTTIATIEERIKNGQQRRGDRVALENAWSRMVSDLLVLGSEAGHLQFSAYNQMSGNALGHIIGKKMARRPRERI
jgi:hypothetical protein